MEENNNNQRDEMNISADTFSAIKIGTMLSVPGKKNPVRVTKIVERKSNSYALTTSGRVRRGHVAGGCLTLWKDSGMVTWQPTMNQQANATDQVMALGLAN
tara:strand:+ start:261 stop:563 length:303 start_codon:yes stop_codon:yes gene_type:complete